MLIIGIAIIAILAAILFPVFAQAREKARGISYIDNNVNEAEAAPLLAKVTSAASLLPPEGR